MTTDVSALLVFCEGPHDVAFVRLILKNIFGFKVVNWKFSEFPAPFNQFFSTTLTQHAAEDLNLDMAHKFFLPDSVMQKNDQLILLFNSGGSSKVEEVKVLLTNILPLLERAKVFTGGATSIVTESRFLFLYDADEKGAAKIQEEFIQNFSIIDDKTWINADVNSASDNPMATTIDPHKGVYIWGASEEEGTLEDLLIPLLQQSDKELMNKAEEAVNGMFVWDTQAEEKKHAVAEAAKRFKAIITLAGQRKKPGSSMNIVIDQARLVSTQTLKESKAVIAFIHFIGNFAQLKENSKAGSK